MNDGIVCIILRIGVMIVCVWFECDIKMLIGMLIMIYSSVVIEMIVSVVMVFFYMFRMLIVIKVRIEGMVIFYDCDLS